MIHDGKNQIHQIHQIHPTFQSPSSPRFPHKVHDPAVNAQLQAAMVLPFWPIDYSGADQGGRNGQDGSCILKSNET
jgi:hypothetical protein